MKTLHDWVEEARKARKVTPLDAARCLRAAEPLVERGSHWSMLAEAWAALGHDGHDDARRCAAQAVIHGDRDVSVYRGAATIHARDLHDLASARAALDRCFEVFAPEADVQARDWRYLANSYADVLSDSDAARRCLARGMAQSSAASVSDLCTLAEGYIEHLDDKATARALVERAMALAETTPPADLGSVLWTLAHVHRYALHDPEAGWRILERSLERANTVAGCLRIAHAAANHTEAEPLHRPFVLACLNRAERRAGATDDWIATAEAWHEHRGDPADIRRCLERALARDPNDAERMRIAFGYRHWLGDVVSADRLSARGVAPMIPGDRGMMLRYADRRDTPTFPTRYADRRQTQR
jgi:tetratricopeptide (TPR) repeat protein